MTVLHLETLNFRHLPLRPELLEWAAPAGIEIIFVDHQNQSDFVQRDTQKLSRR